MWSCRHWKTADPRAERDMILHPERLFFRRGDRKKCMVQDAGSREGVAEFEGFLVEMLLYQPTLSCV